MAFTKLSNHCIMIMLTVIRLSVTQERFACSTNRNCRFYGDCCEAPRVNQNLQSAPWPWSPPTCSPTRSIISGINYVYTVEKCTKFGGWNDIIRRQCEVYNLTNGIQYAFPVSAKGIIFKNRYCAKCNSLQSIQVPQVRVACNGSAALKEKLETNQTLLHILLLSKQCQMTVTSWPKSVAPHPCFPRLVKVCKSKGNGTSCVQGGTNYTVCANSSDVFANGECAECNLGTCQDPTAPPRAPLGRKYQRRFDFSFLFQLDSGAKQRGSASSYTAVSVISQVCSYVSIASLVVMISVYSYLPNLRRFGNALIGSLGLSLLLMYVFFIASNETEEGTSVCYAFAVMLNVLIDSAIVWSGIVAYHLLRTFATRKRCSTRAYGSKTYAAMACVGWGVPVVLVAVQCLLDRLAENTLFEPILPKYGKPVCWLNNPTALSVWVFTPVCIILLLNLCAAICMTISLMKTTRETQLLRKEETVKRRHESGTTKGVLIVVIKVTVAMGLAWIPSIVAEFIPSLAVRVVASLLSGLQGFMLSFLFLGKKSIVRDVRSRFSSSSGRPNNAGRPLIQMDNV